MKQNEFVRGLRAGLSVGIGYLSVSFAFGVTAVGSGFTAAEAVLISMTNVTSAGQIAALPMLMTLSRIPELVLTQFFINLRYALMAVSLSQKVDGSVRLRDRFAVGFVITDEVFAIASTENGDVGRRFLYGLITAPYIGWSVGTALGALAGSLFPPILIGALGIAVYGMFVAIIVPLARKDVNILFCVLIAAALGCLFRFVPALAVVPEGFVIILCSVGAAALMAVLRPIAEEEAAS